MLRNSKENEKNKKEEKQNNENEKNIEIRDKEEKQKKKEKEKQEVLNFLIEDKFLSSTVPGLKSKIRGFEEEIINYNKAITCISILIECIKNPSSIKQEAKKEIETLIEGLDENIRIAHNQLMSGLTVGGQVAARLEQNKKLRLLYQEIAKPEETLRITIEGTDDFDERENHLTLLKEDAKDIPEKIRLLAKFKIYSPRHNQLVDYFNGLGHPDNFNEKMELIQKLETLKHNHVTTKKSLKDAIKQVKKSRDCADIALLSKKVEEIKNKYSDNMAGFKKERIDKLNERRSNLLKEDAERRRLEGDVRKLTHSEKLELYKKTFDLKIEEEINKLLKPEVIKAIKKVHAISKVVGSLDTTSSRRTPILDIYNVFPDSEEKVQEKIEEEKPDIVIGKGLLPADDTIGIITKIKRKHLILESSQEEEVPETISIPPHLKNTDFIADSDVTESLISSSNEELLIQIANDKEIDGSSVKKKVLLPSVDIILKTKPKNARELIKTAEDSSLVSAEKKNKKKAFNLNISPRHKSLHSPKNGLNSSDEMSGGLENSPMGSLLASAHHIPSTKEKSGSDTETIKQKPHRLLRQENFYGTEKRQTFSITLFKYEKKQSKSGGEEKKRSTVEGTQQSEKKRSSFGNN